MHIITISRRFNEAGEPVSGYQKIQDLNTTPDDDSREEIWTLDSSEPGKSVKVVKLFRKENGKWHQVRETWFHFENGNLVLEVAKSGCSDDGQWYPVYGDERKDYCHRQDGDVSITEITHSRFKSKGTANPRWLYVGNTRIEQSPREVIESYYIVNVATPELSWRTVTTRVNGHYSVKREYTSDPFTKTLRLLSIERTYSKTLKKQHSIMKKLNDVGLHNLIVDNLLNTPGKPVIIRTDDHSCFNIITELKQQVYCETGYQGLFVFKRQDPLWGVSAIYQNGTKMKRKNYPELFEEFHLWPEFKTSDIFLLSLIDTEDDDYQAKMQNQVAYANWLADNRQNRIFYWTLPLNEPLPDEIASKFDIYEYDNQ